MPDQDIATARREIADALLSALDRRHEVLDVIVEAEDRSEAVSGIAKLLGTSKRGAEAVFGLSFDRITRQARDQIAAELENLNSQLSFTASERPASLADSLRLRPFAPAVDRDIFTARTDDTHTAGDGSGAPAGDIDDEIGAALARVEADEAAWFVALEGPEKVGMVFGELLGGEVNVRIWIHPQYRKRGYGTAALRRSRTEMAVYFPAVPMVVRAPGAAPL
jgi:GNAT superfamily N-acetyltransferase